MKRKAPESDGPEAPASASSSAGTSMQEYANSMTCRVKVANLEPLLLVRLPDYVTAAVGAVAPGTEIGSIVFRRAAAAPGPTPGASLAGTPPGNTLEAHVRLIPAVVRDVPTQYAARMRPAADPTVVFTQRAADRVISVQGVLADVLDVKPVPGPGYSDFLRQRSRLRAEAQPIRKLSHRDHKQLSGRSFSTVFNTERRARGDLATVRRQILQLFAEQQYWRHDDVSARLKQPLDFVRSILDSIADFHRNPPLKGLWELKPELRSFRSLDGAAAEALGANSAGADSYDQEEFDDA